MVYCGQALLPHGQHRSHDVNVTSSGDHHHEDVHDEGDMEEVVVDHAGASVEMVWKGLVVLAGIYAFFVTERLISLCRTARRRCNEVYFVGLEYNYCNFIFIKNEFFISSESLTRPAPDGANFTI